MLIQVRKTVASTSTFSVVFVLNSHRILSQRLPRNLTVAFLFTKFLGYISKWKYLLGKKVWTKQPAKSTWVTEQLNNFPTLPYKGKKKKTTQNQQNHYIIQVGKSIKFGVAVKSAVGWPVNDADFCPSCRQIHLNNRMAWAENPQSRAFLSHTLQAFHEALSHIMDHSGPHKSSFVTHKFELLSDLSSFSSMVQPSLDPPSLLLHSVFPSSLSILHILKPRKFCCKWCLTEAYKLSG